MHGAPMKHKHVKYEILSGWFSSEIKEEINKCNKCKKNKDTENYRIWRNQVVKLIKQGKSNTINMQLWAVKETLVKCGVT